MSQFDLFTDPAEEGAPRITVAAPVITKRGQYNALGLPTAAFLAQIQDAPDDDFDREDYLRGRWLRNLPLVPDEAAEAIDDIEIPADDPVMKIIPPLNGLLMRAVDLGGGNTACRPLVDGIGRIIYKTEDESPARTKKQQLALHRWLRHTLLQELPDLPGITPSDLWHTLEAATPRACPISASLHGRHLTQETHDRLWQGIRLWEKQRGAATFDDNGSIEAEMRREFIGPEQMILSGIKPRQRTSVRAAALGAASHLIEGKRLRIWPGLYHSIMDAAANSHGIVKERAERLVEPLEDVRDKAVETAMASARRTVQEWYREPPR